MQLFDLKKRNAIAIIYPEPILSTVPGLCHFIEKLANRKIAIDIYTAVSEHYELPEFDNKNIQIHSLNYPKWYKRKFPLTLIPSKFILKTFLFLYSLKKYKLIIGVDPVGIVTAFENNMLNMPLGYFSLELLINEELKDNEVKLRLKEIEAIKKVKYLFISDKQREEIFLKYNPSFAGKVI